MPHMGEDSHDGEAGNGRLSDADQRLAKIEARRLEMINFSRSEAGLKLVEEHHEREELARSIIALDPQRSAEYQVPQTREGVPVAASMHPSAEMMVLAAGVAIFAKAYLEALGKRLGEGTADLPKKMKDLMRARTRKKDAPDEIHIGTKGGEAAILVFTPDLPDEARLALLDLDITAVEIRGKLLRWDSDAMAWRASSTEEHQKPISPE